MVCKRGITSVQTLVKITYVITNEQQQKITNAGPKTRALFYIQLTMVITNEQQQKITNAGPKTRALLYLINDDKRRALTHDIRS